jgi:hypothetical protein
MGLLSVFLVGAEELREAAIGILDHLKGELFPFDFRSPPLV